MAHPEQSIFDHRDEADDAARLAEAEADISAGRLIPNAEVMDWVRTWGTPEEGPPPKSWLK
jgi:predicted transcriptional regulator